MKDITKYDQRDGFREGVVSGTVFQKPPIGKSTVCEELTKEYKIQGQRGV